MQRNTFEHLRRTGALDAPERLRLTERREDRLLAFLLGFAVGFFVAVALAAALVGAA